LGGVVGRFAATFTGVRAAARDTFLRGFFDMPQVPDRAAISGLSDACKRA